VLPERVLLELSGLRSMPLAPSGREEIGLAGTVSPMLPERLAPFGRFGAVLSGALGMPELVLSAPQVSPGVSWEFERLGHWER